jgi:hypothetical protein
MTITAVTLSGTIVDRLRRASSLAGFAGLAGLATACAAELVDPSHSKVWSTANSNDGYASCPSDTTVTGGGFELKDRRPAVGHVPIVAASTPDGNGWKVVCTNPDGTASNGCRAWALCASVLAR